MFGFVAALSSAVTVIILIIASSLLNLLNVYNQNEQARKSGLNYNIDKVNEENKSNGNNNQFALGVNVLSSADVTNILKYRDGRDIYITCSYGNNLSEEVARKLLSFNFLRLKYHADLIENDKNIKINPLDYDALGTNSCSIVIGK